MPKYITENGIFMFVMAKRKFYWAKLFIIGMMAHLAFMFGFNALSLFYNDSLINGGNISAKRLRSFFME